MDGRRRRARVRAANIEDLGPLVGELKHPWDRALLALLALVLLGALVSALTACGGTPAQPTPVPPATETPTPTPTAAPPSPTATPVPVSPTPTPGGLRDVALYSAGSLEQPELYALERDGTSSAADVVVYRGSVTSPRGRWLAAPGGTPPAHSVEVRDAALDIVHRVELTADFSLFGMAFDPPGERLALLEVGSPGAAIPWALVIVDLADGSTERFASPGGDLAEGRLLPASPLGWSADGQELIVSLFAAYTEGGFMGVWALSIPPGATSQPIAELDRRRLLEAQTYRAQPRLAPDGRRLLYLARTEDYTPENYAPVAYDLAVNRLEVLPVDDAAAAGAQRWVEVTDGGALGRRADFSPSGERALYTRGAYADGQFGTLAFRIHDGTAVTEVGPVPLVPGVGLVDLRWCRPDQGLALLVDDQGVYALYLVNVPEGDTTLVASKPHIEVLGCRYPEN
jgi:hypothetical protein